MTNEWVSETIFTTLFVSFMLWTFSPFVFVRKRFYTAVIWSRLLMVLVGEHELACSHLNNTAAAVKLHASPSVRNVQV